MKKNNIILISVIGIIVAILIFVVFSFKFLDKNINHDIITQEEYYNVNEDEVALIYNYNLQSAKGIYRYNKVYLPVDFVSAILDDRFYFNKEEGILIYTTPTQIISCNFDTKGQAGNPLLIQESDITYIVLDIVKTYTDISEKYFDTDGVKKIFVNNEKEARKIAYTKRKTAVRVEAGSNYKIVAKLPKASKVVLIYPDEEYLKNKKIKWVKVFTENGDIAYIKKNKIKKISKDKIKKIDIKDEYKNIKLKEPIILAWHQVTNMDANKYIDTLLENTKGINVISPTWFSLLDNDGNYKSLANKDYVNNMHKKNIQVWALIDNFNTNVNSEKLLSSTKARTNLIQRLVEDVKTYGIDGINIDFEALSGNASKHYIQFMRELSTYCRKEQIVLSVDVPSYAVFNTLYNRKALAQVSDYVINMGYDEHYAGSDMGSVASISYVEDGIINTLKEVPSEKLINAMPLYTRIWYKEDGKDKSKAVGIKSANDWIIKNKVELKWLSNLAQNYGTKEIDGIKYYIWHEDNMSLKEKLALQKKYNLSGIALWKLGLDSKEVWDIFN